VSKSVPRTRFDPLVGIRERTELRALENLANAHGYLQRAARRLEGVRRSANADGRVAGTAKLWIVEEDAHARARAALHAAEREVAAAAREERSAQATYQVAQRAAEVARRAREGKRAEILAERARAEGRALDEQATLAFNARR